MRTTLTLDDDIAHSLTEIAHTLRKPFKQVVNETLRRGLGPAAQTPRKHVQVVPIEGGFAPGIDERRLNQLFDQMEVDDFLRQEANDRDRTGR